MGYVQQTLAHYIENTGTEDLRFLEMFKASRYEDLSPSEWLSHTPAELVMARLNIDKATYDAIPKEKTVIVPLVALPRPASDMREGLGTINRAMSSSWHLSVQDSWNSIVLQLSTMRFARL